jgi:hypothetical protein
MRGCQNEAHQLTQEPPEIESETNIHRANESDSPQEAAAAMLDVHVPREALYTWKGFFIHIATIVIGLLIAIGLEQTVEFFHHRHQVAETREALRIEQVINVNRFAYTTEDFYRYLPKLETNLAIFQYLRLHPGASPEQWPGRLSWYSNSIDYSDSAWAAAQGDGVLQYMPQWEVRRIAELYRRLKECEDAKNEARSAKYQAMRFAISNPEPSQLPAAMIEREIDLISEALQRLALAANKQRNLARAFPEFKPAATGEDIQRALNMHWNDDDVAAVDAQERRLRQFEESQRPSSVESLPGQATNRDSAR